MTFPGQKLGIPGGSGLLAPENQDLATAIALPRSICLLSGLLVSEMSWRTASPVLSHLHVWTFSPHSCSSSFVDIGNDGCMLLLG